MTTGTVPTERAIPGKTDHTRRPSRGVARAPASPDPLQWPLLRPLRGLHKAHCTPGLAGAGRLTPRDEALASCGRERGM